MGKSLSDIAKGILMKEDSIPSVSSSDNDPDRDAKRKTSNSETLKPKSKHADDDPKSNEADDLGGATPTSLAKDNLGAKAAAGLEKDKSKSGIPTVGPEQRKSLSETIENIEMTEELEDFINEKLEEGLSEEEIVAEISENFEIIEEESKDDSDDDDDDSDDDDDDKKKKMDEKYDWVNRKNGSKKGKEGIAKSLGRRIKDARSKETANADEYHRITHKEIDPRWSGRVPTTDKEMSDLQGKADKALAKSVHQSTRKDIAKIRRDNLSEHVDALLSGENLSEEFKQKATTIFEAAVTSRVQEEVSIIEEAFESSLNEQVEEIKRDLSEQVDDFLQYTVEKWHEDNEVAIETSLRTELTEEFISGLRSLFIENYIDIPEDKVSIVDDLGERVSELETKLNEEIEKNIVLIKENNQAKQFSIFVSACEGLTDTQAERLKSLSEGLEFTTSESYAEKLETLKENYFAEPTKKLESLDKATSDNPSMITENLSPRMNAYVHTLGKHKNK